MELGIAGYIKLQFAAYAHIEHPELIAPYGNVYRYYALDIGIADEFSPGIYRRANRQGAGVANKLKCVCQRRGGKQQNQQYRQDDSRHNAS